MSARLALVGPTEYRLEVGRPLVTSPLLETSKTTLVICLLFGIGHAMFGG